MPTFIAPRHVDASRDFYFLFFSERAARAGGGGGGALPDFFFFSLFSRPRAIGHRVK